ncbi:pyruvate kinase [Fuerstiella marisgermanici]|uniref:Pyruvate kinase n=1 Tax=Fuerstiella marisgermanici TaxID=1891926 RepID=A0A1P8WJ70_9PLAN|nr:pyruvate kinase [Fuerstiella marisgermanici]APZ94103.1 Pyruvate kinase [Fuerstiella marisgermanici]
MPEISSPHRKLVKTRIIATVGPACENAEVLRKLIVAGVDVFRLNFAHGSHEWLSGILATIREVAAELKTPVGVLGDLSGPKIRLGEIADGEVYCAEGTMFRFVRAANSGVSTDLTCTYEKLIDDVDPGDRILLADGTVSMLVTAKADDGQSVNCLVAEPGIIRSRQGVNLPGVALSTPSVTEKDEFDLKWALQNRLDFIGLSFVRSAADITHLKQLIEANGSETRPLIVAKIEKTEAIADLKQILEVTDAVMVARGDLGVEAEISRVPILQKDIIRRSNAARIPVITATQMLDSMTTNDLPTRAEVSDVANAVIDGTDAVMLSGETAIGQHPVTCVRMMQKIIDEAEPYVIRTGSGDRLSQEFRRANPITEAVSLGATIVAEDLDADLIVVATESGRTALALSRMRGQVPILAVTHREDTVRRMCLFWGVTSIQSKLVRQSADALLQYVVQWGLENRVLKSGHKIVVVGHTNWLGEGHDLMMVHVVP